MRHKTTEINIEIMILGLNTVSLAVGEYLNRSNLYHNYLIIGNNIYSPTNDLEKYLINTLPIIVGQLTKSANNIYISINNERISIPIPKIYVMTDEKYMNILNIHYNDLLNTDSRLINHIKRIMVSPLIALKTDAEYIMNRKTGHLMGRILIEYLDNKAWNEIKILHSDIPIFPTKLVNVGMGVIWYKNTSGYTELKIDDKHIFPIKEGLNILIYHDLQISKETVYIKCI